MTMGFTARIGVHDALAATVAVGIEAIIMGYGGRDSAPPSTPT